MDVSEQELQELYSWVDGIPLSRPKRNIARDFSDGVLMAEIVHHYFPKLVELHNYSSANASQQKMYNWNTMNQKVFKRLGFTLSKPEFEAAANCHPGAIERILKLCKSRITQCVEQGFTGAPTGPTMIPQAAAVVSTRPSDAVSSGGMQGKDMQMMHTMVSVPAYNKSAAGALPVAMPMAQAHSPLPQHVMPQPRLSKGQTSELLAEKDHVIGELKETNEILETKVRKLEQLVRLKDAKISTLMAKLQGAGLA